MFGLILKTMRKRRRNKKRRKRKRGIILIASFIRSEMLMRGNWSLFGSLER